MKQRYSLSTLAGASFLMASTAIGPGFLTQTTAFTQSFVYRMALIILCVIVLDLTTQLNTWRIVGVTGLRAQEIANKIFPGLGYFVSLLVAMGGFAFCIGDIGGSILGLNVLFGIKPLWGAIITCILSISIFLSSHAKDMMDKVVKILGSLMVLGMLYIVINSAPPIEKTLMAIVNPVNIELLLFPVITMLGGSSGGYIAFSGAHRLVDAKITGLKNISYIKKSVLMGVSISASMRILLFLAVLSVIVSGGILDSTNPAASAFRIWGGNVGYKIFGVMILFAAVSSIIGGTYSSVSFIKTFSQTVRKFENYAIILFIVMATGLVIFISKPIAILIVAGTLNGFILPIMLTVVLIASLKKSIMGDYQHPKILIIGGIIVVIFSGYLGFQAVPHIISVFLG